MKKIAVILAVFAASAHLEARQLNVASFNIRNETPGDYKHGDGWKERRDALCDLVRFSAFDAFGAQEVKWNQLEDMLARLPSYGYVGVGRDDGDKEGEFSPVLYDKSRFKVLRSGTFWLSETPDKVSFGWDAKCRRVCSYALLKEIRGGKEFWFFNTHLDHVGTLARSEGVRLIVRKINELVPARDAVVITGDFNVDQYSEAYKVMLQRGDFVDCAAVAETVFNPGGTFNAWDPASFSRRHIDHIFVRKGTKVGRFGVLTYYFLGGESTGSFDTANAPEDKKRESRTIHTPSDHFPINAFIEF